MLQKLFLPAAIFLISVMAQAQEVIFSENFDVCALSEKWSVDLRGNQNAVWGVGFPQNSRAEGKSINGTCMLFIDDDLTGDKTAPFVLRITSGWFDGSGFSDLFFKALVHFRRDKTEIFRIIIDNGKKEHIIREFRNVNFTGSKFSDYGQVMSDISLIATDSMRIILEYDDDNVWGWWAGIDDIEVTGIRGGNIVMGENFNECRLPEGWQTEIVTGKDDWKFGKFHDGKTIDGSCFVFFNDDILGENNPISRIRLYSPYFDASEYSDYTLTYDLTYRTYEPTEYIQLYVDNGREWQSVKTYTTDFGGPEINKSKRDSISLSAFRSERIRLIWEYNDGGWAWWAGMDNVKVTGSGSIHDRCNKALALSADGGCIAFDNTYALSTAEINIPDPEGGHGYLYYTLSTDESTDYRLSTQSLFNDRIEIFSGSCEQPERLQSVNRDEYGFKGESLYFYAEPGKSYFARVSGYQAEFGYKAGRGCIRLEKKADPVPLPSADLCHDAISLTSGADCAPAKNIKAIMHGPVPKDNHRSRADIWYKFIPQEAGDYEFLSECDFSESLAVYTGNCEGLTEINASYSGKNISIPQAQPGEVYFIQVTGFFSTLEGFVCGRIVHKPDISSPNDECIHAVPLVLNNTCLTYSNRGATHSEVRPSCDAYSLNDVWFTFFADNTGVVYLRVKTDFERIISVFEGQCNSLKSVYCEKQGHHCNGYVQLAGLKPGKQYYLMVGAVKAQTGIDYGNICVQLSNVPVVQDKLKLQVSQECVSRGAVLFTPEVEGGNGMVMVEGPGIQAPVAGGQTYYLEARDQEGCVAAIPVQAATCNDFGCTIAVSPERKHVSCFGMQDGSIALDITGGLGQYQTVWNTGHMGTKIENIPAGTYIATITDGSGCELVQAFTVSQPAQIVSNYEITNPACFGDSTGAVSLFVTGGVSPFTYLWSDGSTEDRLLNVPAGTYSLLIRDVTDCVVEEQYTITQPDALAAQAEIMPVRCPGENSGSIVLSLRGGTAPYKWTWSNGSTQTHLTELSGGNYNLSVTDRNNCMLSTSFEVPAPDDFVLTLLSANLTITDDLPAYIHVALTGGTPPYDFIWSRDGIATGQYLSSINIFETGIYRLTAKDSRGCVFESQSWVIDAVSAVDDRSGSAPFVLYPNPASDFIYVHFDRNTPMQSLKILDANGALIRTIDPGILHKPGLQLSVQDLTPGYYTLEYAGPEGRYKAGFVRIR